MNKKNIVTALGYIFIGIIVVIAFARISPFSNKPVTSELYSMNTIIDISIYGPDKEKAMNSIIKEIYKINSLVNDFSDASDVYKINKNAGIKPVVVNPITIDMIEKSVEIAKETNGAFNITVYPLSKIWGFKGGGYRIPSKKEIKEALKLVSYKDIEINPQNDTVFLKKAGEGIDLGGIAKGYTLDLIKKTLSCYSITSALINMGGNILTYKMPPHGKYWKIGIKNPRGSGIAGVINIKGTKFISTSGDYERYFIKDGIRYCHIMNPFTGYPSNKITSITVISDKGYLGDALSTAFFVEGKTYALKNAKKFHVSIIGFDRELKHFISPEISDLVTFEK